MFDGAASRWLVNRTNPEYLDYVSRLASVSNAFAQVLVNRGIKTSEQLDTFLNPDLRKLSDPFELPGIKVAVERIKNAKERGESILVCGDYDADGVTATAIMVEGLRQFGLEAHYFIPNRMTHGYGLGQAGIEKAKEVGASLVVTVDCGITSLDAVSSAKASGLDVIVTDHHEPARQKTEDRRQKTEVRSQKSEVGKQEPEGRGGFLLPEAVAIINPKLLNSSSALYANLSGLSGAGVAFKLVSCLFDNNIDDVYHLLDLAAIGTTADVVPMLDDNRIIVSEGMKLIRSGRRPGIKALKEAAGIRQDSFRTSSLHYLLIPRINAAGRIADAGDVVRLLTTRSDNEAASLAKWLNDLNYKRQELEERVYTEAKGMLDSMDVDGGPIVLAGAGWHFGVVGIVASRIAERYYRPAFVLSVDNGEAKGSARSIPPFDIHSGLAQCSAILNRFGGHKQAAGLSLKSCDIDRFRSAISDVFTSAMSEEDRIPVLNIDAAVSISDISIGLVEELSRLEPFGYCNCEPLFAAKGLEVMQPRIVGNNHLKMRLRQRGRKVDCIGFDFGGLLGSVAEKGLIDAAFIPAINEWDGGRFLQLNLKALRPSA